MRERILYGVSMFVALIVVIGTVANIFSKDTSQAVTTSVSSSRPHYQITADYQKDKNEVKGHVKVTLGRERSEEQREVYFHLYPNYTYLSFSKPPISI